MAYFQSSDTQQIICEYVRLTRAKYGYRGLECPERPLHLQS